METTAARCGFHNRLLQLDLITDSVKAKLSEREKVPSWGSWM